jgi:hypothetical protein
MAIASENIEDRDRQAQRREHAVQNQQVPPLAAVHPRAERSERQEQPEVQPEKRSQDPGVVRVCLYGLRIRQFGGVEREQNLLAEQHQPLRGMGSNERERSAQPEVGDFRRRQRTAGGLRRETRGILALEHGIAAAGHQRLVRAGRLRVVANVEVRAKLRRGDDELAPGTVVPQGHRQDHER